MLKNRVIKQNITESEKNFYAFEMGPNEFAIYNSHLDEPIYIGGSLGFTKALVYLKTFKKNAFIHYYTVEKSGLLKYSPDWSHVPSK